LAKMCTEKTLLFWHAKGIAIPFCVSEAKLLLAHKLGTENSPKLDTIFRFGNGLPAPKNTTWPLVSPISENNIQQKSVNEFMRAMKVTYSPLGLSGVFILAISLTFRIVPFFGKVCA